MRKTILLSLLLCFCLLAAGASADRARFLSSDRDTNYHVSHLEYHVGLTDCRVSGNYLKVRSRPGGDGIIGHVEQADTVELCSLNGKWAEIRVIYASPTSPDSWAGLQGYIDSDYLECPCDNYVYYHSSAFSEYYSMGQLNGQTSAREIPGRGSRAMFTLYRGNQVIVLGEYTAPDGSSWLRVMSDTRCGFVPVSSIDILSSSDIPVAPDGSPSRGGIGADPGMPTYIPNGASLATLLHDSTNVRDRANGNVIARLRRNTTVAVLDRTQDSKGVGWYHVSFGDRREGYIREDLLSLQESVQNSYGQNPYAQNPYYMPTTVPVIPTAVPTVVPTALPTMYPSYGTNVDYQGVYSAYIRQHSYNYTDFRGAKMKDIDGDGIPELFVDATLGVRGECYVYTYFSGAVVPLCIDYSGTSSPNQPGSDMNDNCIGGGGSVYFDYSGIGILGGGSNSASEEEYSRYEKDGFALRVRESLVIRYSESGNATYHLVGYGYRGGASYVSSDRTLTRAEAYGFLSSYMGAEELFN